MSATWLLCHTLHVCALVLLPRNVHDLISWADSALCPLLWPMRFSADIVDLLQLAGPNLPPHVLKPAAFLLDAVEPPLPAFLR